MAVKFVLRYFSRHGGRFDTMRPRLVLGYCVTLTFVVTVVTTNWSVQSSGTGSPRTASVQSVETGSRPPMIATQPAPTTTPMPEALPLLRPNPVTLTAPGFWSWALLNRRNGVLAGSPNANRSQVTASMIKAWLAADYLRIAASKGQQPSSAALNQLSIMIRDSDNDAASATYVTVGKAASIARLIRICGLTDSRAGADWAHTLVSARDAARMGQCIADGRGAGAKWTQWVLTEMREVRGAGRFGAIEVLPAAEAEQTAIKNGWVNLQDGNWHVNCLAIGSDWVLAVENVYPVTRGMSVGTANCRSITQQLMATTG
jgi:hypothetical protein